MCLRHRCRSRVWCWLVYTSKIERSEGDFVDVSVTCAEEDMSLRVNNDVILG